MSLGWMEALDWVFELDCVHSLSVYLGFMVDVVGIHWACLFA